MRLFRMCSPEVNVERKNHMVGLLTLDSRIYNYGGFLQEMALQDAIKGLGYECEVIDYDVSQEYNTFSLKRGVENFSFEKLKGKFIKERTVLCPNSVADSIAERKRAFDRYRAETIGLSQKMDYEALHDKNLSYDQLVCGSDQIWNPDYNIPSFFLNFGRSGCKRIIYAASIGKDHLSRHENKTYEKLLKYPNCVSVREESAQNIISKLTNKKVELVLDPTLLHQLEYWNEKANGSSLEYRDYIFCYFLNLTDEKVDAANDFARKNGSEIIAIPYLHNEAEEYSTKLKGTLVSAISPADFLNLIRNAKVVLTDSFHATVFSIIFQKEFWCFGRNAGVYSMNTRLHTLLGYVGMRDRMITPNELKNKVYNEHISINLDYLKNKQEESLAFLRNALVQS